MPGTIVRCTQFACAALVSAALGMTSATAAPIPAITFAPPHTYWTGWVGGSGYMETTTTAADFNNDGYPDLAVANYFTGIGPTILLNDRHGGFTDPGYVYPVNILIGTTVAADVNNDGNTDLVVSNFWSVVVLIGHGDGTFHTGETYLMPQGGQEQLQLRDVDDNGVPDLVVLTRFGIDVQLGRGDGTFGPPIISLVPSLPSPLLSGFDLGDFDGDGTPDLVAADAGLQRVWALKGDGHGRFSYLSDVWTPTIPSGVLARDMNNDGVVDIVAFPEFNVIGPQSVTVALSDGHGGWGPPRSFDGGFTPVSAAAADFNGDGNIDIVSSDTITSRLVILQGDGTGALSVAAREQVSLFQQTPAVADFDGDGKPDIAVVGSSALDPIQIPGLSGATVLLNNTDYRP